MTWTDRGISQLCEISQSGRTLKCVDEDEELELPDWQDPVNAIGSLRAHAEVLVAGYRQHEYWSDPMVQRQVLRGCAATVERLGALAGRIADDDPELAEATRWLADLLAWHGRRVNEAEADRPGRPFRSRFRY